MQGNEHALVPQHLNLEFVFTAVCLNTDLHDELTLSAISKLQTSTVSYPVDGQAVFAPLLS